MRSGNRNGGAKVFGRIAGLTLLVCGAIQAPILAPLPAPLSALVSSNSQARLSILASGLTDPRNLRLQSDGSLLLDAPGDSLEYRVAPHPAGGADVLLAAREMRDEVAHAQPGPATFVDLEWTSRHDARDDDIEWRRESLEAAIALSRVPRTEAVLAVDGTLFVAALDDGIVYRVALPRARLMARAASAHARQPANHAPGRHGPR